MWSLCYSGRRLNTERQCITNSHIGTAYDQLGKNTTKKAKDLPCQIYTFKLYKSLDIYTIIWFDEIRVYAVYTSTPFQHIINEITQQKQVGASRSISIESMLLVMICYLIVLNKLFATIESSTFGIVEDMQIFL